MMFSREPPVHAGRQRGARSLSPLSPSSPLHHYTSLPPDLSIPSSPPVKMEGSYYPPSPALKIEPMSPNAPLAQTHSAHYSRGPMGGRDGSGESHSSPCPSSLDSLPSFSPISLGAGVTLTTVSSPLTSPLSPSSTATPSPSAKIGKFPLFSYVLNCCHDNVYWESKFIL